MFLIEFVIVFLVSAAGLAFLAWRMNRYTGKDVFSDRNYLITGIAVAVVVAIIRLISFNERKVGQAFF